MADTTEMLRLIRHAASRLAEEHPEEIQVAPGMTLGAQTRSQRQLLSLTVAMRQAEIVLRMVAACMDDEPAEPPDGGG